MEYGHTNNKQIKQKNTTTKSHNNHEIFIISVIADVGKTFFFSSLKAFTLSIFILAHLYFSFVCITIRNYGDVKNK